MGNIRINTKLGTLAMCVFFILFGLISLFQLTFNGINIVLGLAALIAGVLILLD